MASVNEMRAQRAALYDEMKNLHEGAARRGQDLTGKQLKRWNELDRQVDELADEIDQKVRDERAAAVEHHMSEGEAGQGRVHSLLPDERTMRSLHAAVEDSTTVRLESRATVLTGDTGADELTGQMRLSSREPRRIARAAGIPSQRVRGVESVSFPTFLAGDADITAEGVTKAEYDNISGETATPSLIAIWTDVSRQTLLTQTSFEAKLRQVLASKVARREDELLTTTALATTGIGTLDMASPDPDALLEAAGMVAASDVAAEPNLALVNPADLADLVGVDVGSGGRASPGLEQFLPTVAGMALYPTDAIDAGEIVVGAWRAAARYIVGLAPVYLVDAVSGIKENRVTILLEEAVALAVDEPSGFVHLRPAP